GAERAVIAQPRPGNRQMLLSHAEESAEAEHRIGDIAAELVDHEALDGADLVAIGAADRGAFDPVTGDQAVRLTGRCVGLHGLPPVDHFSLACSGPAISSQAGNARSVRRTLRRAAAF